jgi:hypothetical protein
MTTYCVGFTREQLALVNLTANTYLLGNELSYTPSIVKHEFDKEHRRELKTFSTQDGYEGTEYYDVENNILCSGDTVIVSWWVSYIYQHLMKGDGINVIILKTDYGDIVKVI